MNAIENNVMTTAYKIRAAACEYNREFPEAVADIEQGEPQVRVTYGAKQGSRFITFTVTAGIYHNGFVAAHDPICHQIYRCESRKLGGCEKFARRLGNRLCNSNVKVVVIGRCI